jgi:hypothetical protein
MGIVYRAEDLKLGRDVALKFLPPEQVSDALSLRRFQREARTASVLNHPNVCTVYSVEDLAGQPAIVMEMLEGETLEARLKAGVMPAADAIALAIPIAAAMEAAHRKGIVHRDLKPANIVITANGVKVVDFGLAKIALAPNVTQGGAILGTPNYMAPEQMLGEEAGPVSDIYSFGVILREMLGGRTDSAPVERVIARCLERDPGNRWQSAGDLKAALEMIGTRTPRRALPRIPLVWPAGLAAAAVVAVALFWLPLGHIPSRLVIPAPAGGTAGRIGVSPDGGRIAYSSGGRLWVRTLGDTESRPLEGTQGAGAPFWSPDSKSVAFGAGGKLRRVSVSGGVPQTICDIHTNAAGVWSSTGDILIGQIDDGIFRVPATGGEVVRLTTPDPVKDERRHVLPQVLPGGGFLYVAGASKPGYNVLWASKSDGRDRKAIMSVESNVALAIPRGGTQAYLVHLRDRVLLAEPFSLQSLERTGPPRTLAAGVGTVPAMGSALQIGDFAAAAGTLAYRAAIPPANPLKLIQNPASPAMPPSPMQSGQEITVLRNWM